MKANLTVAVCMVFLAVLLIVLPASAQGKLEGVWRITEVTITGQNATKIPVEATHPNLMIFTKKHFSFLNITAVPPQRDLPQQGATDAQKVAAWTPVVAWAGTYEVKGNVLTFHMIIDKDPSGMVPGNFETAEFKIEGDTFTWTSKSDQKGPFTNPITTKLVRVE